jgi:hypothetical protein
VRAHLRLCARAAVSGLRACVVRAHNRRIAQGMTHVVQRVAQLHAWCRRATRLRACEQNRYSADSLRLRASIKAENQVVAGLKVRGIRAHSAGLVHAACSGKSSDRAERKGAKGPDPIRELCTGGIRLTRLDASPG